MTRNEFICDCNVIHQEAVDKVLSKLPNEDTFNRLADLYKLIGDTTRCRILFALDQDEMCVCDLANVLNMTKSSISHQLAVLRRSGIVKCRRNGKEVYYTLDDDHIVKLFEIGLEHINHKG
jgi:cadmium efflux system accessory protein